MALDSTRLALLNLGFQRRSQMTVVIRIITAHKAHPMVRNFECNRILYWFLPLRPVSPVTQHPLTAGCLTVIPQGILANCATLFQKDRIYKIQTNFTHSSAIVLRICWDHGVSRYGVSCAETPLCIISYFVKIPFTGFCQGSLFLVKLKVRSWAGCTVKSTKQRLTKTLYLAIDLKW